MTYLGRFATFRLLEHQRWRCAICRGSFVALAFERIQRRKDFDPDAEYDWSKVYCVDHNHQTGEIRALLCYPCNCRVRWTESETPPVSQRVRFQKRVKHYLMRRGWAKVDTDIPPKKGKKVRA